MGIRILKFLFLVLLLNVIRYLIGAPLETWFVAEQMHSVIPEYPEVFDNNFTNTDFAVSLIYNFMLWLTATWVFYLAYPAIKGSFVTKSLKIFGVMGLFFISLSAVYMNHYTAEVKIFYLYSMLDAVILFPIVGFANGVLFPRIFRRELEEGDYSKDLK